MNATWYKGGGNRRPQVFENDGFPSFFKNFGVQRSTPVERNLVLGSLTQRIFRGQFVSRAGLNNNPKAQLELGAEALRPASFCAGVKGTQSGRKKNARIIWQKACLAEHQGTLDSVTIPSTCFAALISAFFFVGPFAVAIYLPAFTLQTKRGA